MTFHDPDHLILFAVCAIGYACLAIFVRTENKRTEDMQEFARSRGLQFLGSSLPQEYPRASRWSEAYWNKPNNVVFGEQEGDLILAYEVDVPYARSRMRMTVVARRSTTPPVTDSLPTTLIVYERAPWRAVHLTHGFFKAPRTMTTEQIEEVWRQLGARASG